MSDAAYEELKAAVAVYIGALLAGEAPDSPEGLDAHRRASAAYLLLAGDPDMVAVADQMAVATLSGAAWGVIAFAEAAGG